VAPINYATWFDHLVSDKSVGAEIGMAGVHPRNTLLHKTAIDLSGQEGTDLSTLEKITDGQKVFISDT
jgi:hypothetical protein